MTGLPCTAYGKDPSLTSCNIADYSAIKIDFVLNTSIYFKCACQDMNYWNIDLWSTKLPFQRGMIHDIKPFGIATVPAQSLLKKRYKLEKCHFYGICHPNVPCSNMV